MYSSSSVILTAHSSLTPSLSTFSLFFSLLHPFLWSIAPARLSQLYPLSPQS